jgi:Ca2+-transporting ATPase
MLRAGSRRAAGEHGRQPTFAMPSQSPPTQGLASPAWAAAVDEVLRALDVSPASGLTDAEVRRRRAIHGPNQLRARERRGALRVLIDQLRSLLVALLLVASAAAFVYGEAIEGAAIAVVVLLNVGIGLVTELRAVRSLEALRRVGIARVIVRRGGLTATVSAADLVPGDVVLLEAGDVVTADVRLLEASKLEVDQSALTGESVPVPKSVERVAPDAPVPERSCMLFKGTSLTRGSALAVVLGTGMQTELGRISRLVEEAEPEVTPLERRLEALGRRLAGVTILIAAGISGIGIVSGRDVLLMVETGIALAVAAVPEGLPVVATLALARGMWRMARRHALIERLSAVETLGSTSLILCDKTGTLTENHMRAVAFYLAEGEVEVEGTSFRRVVEGLDPHDVRRASESMDPNEDAALSAALRAAVLCNNASLARTQPRATGDPTEAALLEVGAAAGLYREELLAASPELREEAFDPSVQLMATFHASDPDVEVAVKGSPEAVVPRCTSERAGEGSRLLEVAGREAWLAAGERMAARGLRVLAVATRRVPEAQTPPYEGLEILALVGLLDPPRAGVASALSACAGAGIRVVVVTGDHVGTAETVARAVGLSGADGDLKVLDARRLDADPLDAKRVDRLRAADVVARATPEQKLELLALHQQAGAVVAMTGDGVNDAPTLRKADIGIAMGLRGTQVAREAAAMVLEDDEFATIAAAVEQGRVIFGNLRKFTVYLLSCNVSEVMTVGIAAILQGPLPLLPLQILFLNLVTDVFPALALGFGEGERGLMQRPPRPAREGILTSREWTEIGVYGALLTVAVLGSMAAAFLSGMSESEAVTVSFFTLAFAQLWHVLDMRSDGSSPFANDITRNPWVWGALALCAVLLAAAAQVPLLARVLEVQPLGMRGWALVAGFGLAPVVVAQLFRSVARPKPRPREVRAA